MRTLFRIVLILLLGASGVGALLLFTPLGEGPLRALFPADDVAPVDFATLRLTDNPNQFLVCPPGLCAAAAHAEPGTYDMPAAELAQRWRALVATKPRISVLGESEDGLQMDYLQRSARFRFPDVITVRFLPVSDTQSTLAIYSRSIYGKSDLGVNRERIEAWLAGLGAGA